MRVWLDTDLGTDVDDALALAYVLRAPALELVGVSTVFGDVELRTRMTRELLAIAGAADTPLIRGLGKPLTPGRRGVMFGHEGRGLLEDPEPVLRTDSDPDPEARVGELANALAAARPDVVVAIGPLTNLGALARAEVALPQLAIMGGRIEDVELPGMSSAISEWNWYCDPHAVQAVLAQTGPAPPRIVPAEVTFRTALAPGDVERLAEGDALTRALGSLAEEWLIAQRERLGVKRPGVALHDPLTAATLVEPGLCAFRNRRIEIDDEGWTTRDRGSWIEAATDVDPPQVRAHLMETWLASSP